MRRRLIVVLMALLVLGLAATWADGEGTATPPDDALWCFVVMVNDDGRQVCGSLDNLRRVGELPGQMPVMAGPDGVGVYHGGEGSDVWVNLGDGTIGPEISVVVWLPGYQPPTPTPCAALTAEWC